MKTNLIAEIGINHNGDINIAKQLITIAKTTNFTHVKIQKRNPDKCIPEKQKHIMKSTPWGEMRYIDYKKKIEFSEEQIKELVEFSNNLGIIFFASVWDIDSVDIMKKYCSIGKIPSAMITDGELCSYARQAFDFLIISTGMSNEDQIETCVNICNPDVIMHSVAIYPCPVEYLNLNYVKWLLFKYKDKQIGYSGHENEIITAVMTLAMGATWIEKHVTLDNNMWGSDQIFSLTPDKMQLLVNYTKTFELASSKPPEPRNIGLNEQAKLGSLRPQHSPNHQ